MTKEKILEEIGLLDARYAELKKEFESQKLLKSQKDKYLRQDKEAFNEVWNKYIEFLTHLQKLIRWSFYRAYFVIVSYDKLVLKKYLLCYYFKVLVDLENALGDHTTFVRLYMQETFKQDYPGFCKYIYKPNFINLINTPNIFIKPFKFRISKEVYALIDKATLDVEYLNRLDVDYKNVYYYFKKRIDKGLYHVAKFGGLIIAKVRFSTRNKGLISEENLMEYLEMASPGDILLTRGNWNASNLSIPGFWKHMSMYVGTGEYLKTNYKFDFLSKLGDNVHYIIEATSAGIKVVPIRNMTWTVDYLGVSRTNFTEEKKKRTIANALSNVGKEYDFRFNFHSDKNLVCSELVLKSYARDFDEDEGIDINLENIGVSLTYPPNNFVELVYNMQKDENPSLEPVFFIDSLEKTGENFIGTKDDFFESGKRSRSTLFLK